MAFSMRSIGESHRKNRVFTENSVRYCDEIVDKREIDYDGCNCWQDPHVLVIMDGVDTVKRLKIMLFLQQNPNLTAMKAKHPNSLISGSGEDVGLPDGQMGNSEVGHMNLGAGRVLYQDFTRITKDIRTGAF